MLNFLLVSAPVHHHSSPPLPQQRLCTLRWHGPKFHNFRAKERLIYLSSPFFRVILISIPDIAKLNRLLVSAPSRYHSSQPPPQQPLGIPLWDEQKSWNLWAKERLVYLNSPFFLIIFTSIPAIAKLNRLPVLDPSHHDWLPPSAQQPLGIPLWDGRKSRNFWAKRQLVYLSSPFFLISFVSFPDIA